MESIIGWMVPVLGIPISWYSLKLLDIKSPIIIFIAGFAISLALIIGLIFLAVLAYSLCIWVVHLCKNHGDANMSYWFNAFFLFPIYLLLAISGKNESLNKEP